jgi:tetratricopeptide (TPR) repeat protein
LLPWISRSLEGLWLLAVFLVPLAFLDRDYSLSEAKIAYAEVPKIALLRALAAIIAVLWSIEWATKSDSLQGPFGSTSISGIVGRLNPSKAVSVVFRWVKVHPTRWLLLTAILFFGSTLLSTVLSGSFRNSMWGEIPGQDGYSAYTIASYATLFGVIATHLKSQAQLGRLLGAVVLMGVLVGLYGIFQHYNHDFLNLTESTGGGADRVTIFMGNAIFAAAVLTMTVPITLIAATLHFQNDGQGNWGPFSRLGQLQAEALATLLWASVLAVQLLGLMFTFSRGPWSGAVLALAAFLFLIVISLGWRMLIRSGLVLGLTGALVLGFLHWQGNVSVANVGPWLGFVIGLVGLSVTIAVLFFIKRFGRAIGFISAAGVIVAVVGAASLAPSAFTDHSYSDTVGAESGGTSTTGPVGQRISSIRSEVLRGSVGGRSTHWEVSWKLINERPWFEFDDLSLSWLRPVIGYGPDLFRYTYLLESPPDNFRFLPLEPDHAHNFFIHQTVEQGFLGGFAALALFVSVFGVTIHQVVSKRKSTNPMYRILLIGLAAVILGRFLEMSVGVARVSDLTVLWVVFGLFAASLRFDDQQHETEITPEAPPNRRESRRNTRRANRASEARSISIGLILRLAVVVLLISPLGVITWQKSINSVRASIAEGKALKHFSAGDLEQTVVELDNAIRLAPGIPTYYNNRAQVFLAYQLQPGVFTEPGCDAQTEQPYLTCLTLKSIASNLESVNQQPFNYRSKLVAGNSLFNLQLNESAVEQYSTAVSMVPNSFRMRNTLAESQINIGSYSDAIANLEYSLDITEESDEAPPALVLKGRALYELGELNRAEETWKRGLVLARGQRTISIALDSLFQINVDRGVTLDIERFNRTIEENPKDGAEFYFRGLAHLVLGNLNSAIADFRKAIGLGDLPELKANLGYAIFRTGGGPGDLEAAVNANPSIAMFHAYVGEVFVSRGDFAQALNAADTAYSKDPRLGIAAVVRAKSLISLGLERPAKEVLDLSLELGLTHSLHYVDRGQIYTQIGEYDLALLDMNEAIRINPDQASYYDARAKTYAIRGNFESAFEDFTSAIERNPAVGQFFRNRGVLYDILDDFGRADSDFEHARSLDQIANPGPSERDSSYFLYYKDIPSNNNDAYVLLKLMTETEFQRVIAVNTQIKPNQTAYSSALQMMGDSYFSLDLWDEAAVIFSRLIEHSPSSAVAFKSRGDALLILKRYDQAIDHYSLAISLDVFDSANFTARGKGYGEMGEFALARQDFAAAIRIDPNSSDAYKYRGFLSVQSGDSANAFADLDRALEIATLDDDAYFKRARAHIDLGQTSLALKDMERAILLAPTYSDYLYGRGLLMVELGDLKSALEDLNSAIALLSTSTQTNKRSGDIFADRARLHLGLNNLTQAGEDAVNAIRIHSENLRSSVWVADRPAIQLELANAHELLGDVYTRLGDNEKTQDNYLEASRLR